MAAPKKKKDRALYWEAPTPGLEFDIDGPHADYLIDTSEIDNQVVYHHVSTSKDDWEIVPESDAQSYLPKRMAPVMITLGVEEKKSTEIPTYGSIYLSDYLKYKKGYVINMGCSVWGLDFVPKRAAVESDPHIQYLAASGYRGSVDEHIGIGETQPTGTYKNCIQIYKMKLSVKAQEEPTLDLCILHDYGAVLDLQWCPYGVYEEEKGADALTATGLLPKLGILSFTCADGTVRTIVVPHPESIRKYVVPDHDPTKPVYLKIKTPKCTFTIAGGNPFKISWGGHKKLAVGCTWGSIVVFDMESALADNRPKSAQKSQEYIQLSKISLSATVASLSWNGIKNPDRIVAGGYDGHVIILDTHDPEIIYAPVKLRSIAYSVAWAHYEAPFLYSDTDGNCKGLSGAENFTVTSAKYIDAPGNVWDIGVSQHHGQLAIGTSLGWVRSSNMYQIRSRVIMGSQQNVYKLDYSESSKSYRYIDGITFKIADEAEIPRYRKYGDTFMAIQKVVWNPNKRTSGFVASVGTAGLCRIEFEGRGSKWD